MNLLEGKSILNISVSMNLLSSLFLIQIFDLNFVNLKLSKYVQIIMNIIF